MLTKIVGSLKNYYGSLVEQGPFIGNQEHYLQMIRDMPNVRRTSIERSHNIVMESIEARYGQDNIPGIRALEYVIQELKRYMPQTNFAGMPFTAQVREREGKKRLILDYKDRTYQYRVTFNEQPLLYDRLKSGTKRKAVALKKRLKSLR